MQMGEPREETCEAEIDWQEELNRLTMGVVESPSLELFKRRASYGTEGQEH